MIRHDKTLLRSRNSVIEHLLEGGQYKKFAEVGVWSSRLCRGLLRGICGDLLEEYWAIDPWRVMIGEYDGDPIAKVNWDKCHEALAVEKDWFKMYYYCCRLMTYFPQLKVVRMASKEAASIFPDGYLDMVFIDAVHTFDHVYADIGYWLPKVREGGIISGHDYEHENYPGVKEAVDKYFGDDIEVWVPKSKVWIKRL